MATRCRGIVGACGVVWTLTSPLVLAAGSAGDRQDQAALTASAGIIAQAGAITLDGADIRTLVASLPSSERTAATGNLDSLEQVIRADLVRRAVLAEAKASAFANQPETAAALASVRDQALVRLWIASKSAVSPDYPTEADIQAAYDANRQALAAPTQYHVAQIFINAPDGGDVGKLAASLQKATDVAARIATSDFAQLAEKQSEDPQSARGGGDLGWMAENRIQPEILIAIRGLSLGQVVGPVKTAQGLRFLKLLGKKQGTIPALAEVHDRIATALRNQRASQLEQTYLTQYNSKLGVTVNQIELARLQQTLAR